MAKRILLSARTYKKAAGPYFIFKDGKYQEKLTETQYKTKNIARDAAERLLKLIKQDTVYIGQAAYEDVPLHAGAICPWCGAAEALEFHPADSHYDVDYLGCPECDSAYVAK